MPDTTPLYCTYFGMPLDKKMNSMEEGSGAGGKKSYILLSPPDVREVRQFLCLFDNPVSRFGTVAPSFSAGLGIPRKPATSLPSGVAGALSGVRFRVDYNVPLTNRGSGDFIWLLLRFKGEISMWDGGAETQDRTQAAPALFTLGLDAPSDGLSNLLSTSEQGVH